MRPSRVRPLLVLSLLLSPAFAAAQTAPDATPVPKDKTWKFAPRLVIGTEYDDNVFLLPASKRTDPAAPSPAELISGRYSGMEAAGDLITTVSATLAFRGAGLRGRDLTITPELAYESYARNGERSNAAFGVSVEQLLRREGRLRVRAQLQPGYFSRNYLADAVDANVDGDIQPAERVYARGEYSESDLQVDYRRRLVKAGTSNPVGAWLLVGAGFSDRTYDAPFSARDYSGLTGTARLQFDLAHGMELATSYDLALLGSPRTLQVILLDEPVYGQDLNGNGNATDLNARTVRTVDRSRVEQALGETARFNLSKATDLELSVEYRWRTFTSDEPFDVANNGRRDHRMQVGVETSHRVNGIVRVFAGGVYGKQNLNRRTDLGAEGAVDDYSKLRLHAGLRLTR
ncbi:MAG: hypothetical protein K8S21_05380 [Gemmatimonadetes bacterium]|nr:hypothetical protein [Gemmatimonadota bacterium]